MLFNSFVFSGLFLPLTLLLFWCIPAATGKRAVLVFGSLVFYSYWLPEYLLMLLGFVGVAWGCAILAERKQTPGPVIFAGFVLLGGLAYFKYSAFLGQFVVDIGIAASDLIIAQPVLPLGISFIVFQSLAYVVDVYRGSFPVEKRLSVTLLFHAFFPQLIAGPICRAHQLMPQLTGDFTFNLQRFVSGFAIFTLGLLLKEFFADGLAPLVDEIYLPGQAYSFTRAWVGTIGFGGQIYADFWGYSTMAVGLARMFDIDIPVNFRLPYIAISLREFWRRWHITLSQWLRDYLYKSLGGSRKGTARTVLALMATMLLGGLWHGAAYTFIAWGAIHGLALIFEHVLFKRRLESERPPGIGASDVIGWIYTFFVVFVAWVFFRAHDIGQALDIVAAMFFQGGEDLAGFTPLLQQVSFLVVLLLVLQFPIEGLLKRLRHEQLSPPVAVAIAFFSLLAVVVLGAPATVPFIYFQF